MAVTHSQSNSETGQMNALRVRYHQALNVKHRVDLNYKWKEFRKCLHFGHIA